MQHHCYSVRLFRGEHLLAQAEDLSPLPWVTRLTASPSELLQFASRTLAARTAPGQRHGAREQGFVAWACCDAAGLCGVAVVDAACDARLAFAALDRAMRAFALDHWAWSTYDAADPVVQLDMPALEEDPLARVQTGLRSVEATLHDSVERLLLRGERVEELAEKSRDLSASSRRFAQSSRRLNSWCCCVS